MAKKKIKDQEDYWNTQVGLSLDRKYLQIVSIIIGTITLLLVTAK